MIGRDLLKFRQGTRVAVAAEGGYLLGTLDQDVWFWRSDAYVRLDDGCVRVFRSSDLRRLDSIVDEVALAESLLPRQGEEQPPSV